jgi:hypothetical protein
VIGLEPPAARLVNRQGGRVCGHVKVGAAVHLSFQHFDSVAVAFDRAGAVGEGQAVADAGLVAPGLGGEGVQVGQVVGVDAARLPLNIAVSGANRNDCKLLEPILDSISAFKRGGRGHPAPPAGQAARRKGHDNPVVRR